MNLNVGKLDRGLRIVGGLGLIAWALMGGPVWAWIGVVPLATGAVGLCPLYSMLGIKTCSLQSQK